MQSFSPAGALMFFEPSISGQNHHVTNPTAAEPLQMRPQKSARNINFGFVPCDPITAATVPMWQKQSGQHRPADQCSADSHSRINTSESTDHRRRGRKRADKEIVKGDLETCQEIGQLKGEKESLTVQLDKVKTKNKELHERIQQLGDDLEKEKAEHKELRNKYIVLLEKSNQFVNPKGFETRSNNTAQQRAQQPGPASICGSVTGNPANAI